MSTNRKFSIFYFFIIAIFIVISFNLRIKGKNKITGLFPIVNNTKTINQSNLTPAEKIVWENFKTIPKAEYKKRYKEIAESIRPILNSPTDNHIGITILKEVLTSKKLNSEATLFILGKLSTLEISSGQIIDSITTNIEVLKLAEELKSEYHTDRAYITLSSLIARLDGNETAITILNKIPKTTDSYPSKNRVEVMKHFHLAENYFLIKKNSEALRTLENIDSLLLGESETYIQNVLAFKYTLETQIAIDNLDIALAKKKLLAAKEIMNKTTVEHFTGFSSFYAVTNENYNLVADIDNFSVENLLKIIYLSENKVNRTYLDEAYTLLFEYYYLINDINSYRTLKSSFDKNLKNINSSNNEVLVLYLLRSLENRYIESQNLKLYRNLFLLTLITLLATSIAHKQLNSAKQKAETDSLTSLKNRRSFTERSELLKDKLYYMLLFDIDNFKSLNDTYGHEFGDTVLATIGKLLKEIDSKYSLAYRIGGEEFAVIFVNIDENFAKESSEFIRRAISNLTWEHHIKVTISGGFSKNNNDIYQTCDKLLYTAKKSGKNKIIYK
ncbi:GGDEF domain-containing protein [uncultured Cetobacterium sp.]|uniref:GGDEF domain-containing protein n=1 Tax=uncultured Cetobacterium sp. TaxID=527638 RepID=UPI0025FF2250|nr:GGDEF domain-containing protein [uncultured Cetobacterium sp.]